LDTGSLAKRDLIRDALFWWIDLVLTALSNALKAADNALEVGFFLADLTANRIADSLTDFTRVLFRSCRSFFSALGVIGIGSKYTGLALVTSSLLRYNRQCYAKNMAHDAEKADIIGIISRNSHGHGRRIGVVGTYQAQDSI
jgi:hypothetical protein